MRMASMTPGAAVTAVILVAAALVAGTALAQQVPGQPVPDPSGQVELLPGALVPGQDVTGRSIPMDTGTPADTGTLVETVPQQRFEAEPQAEVEAQPRFVRAPGTDGMEVTPLGPPGEPGAEDEGGAGVAVIRESGDVLTPRGPDDAAPVEGGPAGRAAARANRFKSAPQDGGIRTGPTGPAVPIDPAPTELRQGVRLRELDKMTGQTETFELAVGETRQVDRLKIRLDACRSPQGNDTHGTIAFLKIWDVRTPEDEAFSGWMFAESPSLSALDHPRYDLWVISCTTSSIAASAPSE